MKNVMANIHPFYDVYVSEQNMGFWKIVVEGVLLFGIPKLISLATRKQIRQWCILDVLGYGRSLP